jgi:hypothetical protein
MRSGHDPIGGNRFFLEHNKPGTRLRGDHARAKRSDHDPDPKGRAQSFFQRKPAPDLDSGVAPPVCVKKTRRNKKLEPAPFRFNLNGAGSSADQL